MNPQQNMPTTLYSAQQQPNTGTNSNANNQRQVPVRLSSVNFEGVFTSSRLNMENLISQNLYNQNSQQQQQQQQPPPPRR